MDVARIILNADSTAWLGLPQNCPQRPLALRLTRCREISVLPEASARKPARRDAGRFYGHSAYATHSALSAWPFYITKTRCQYIAANIINFFWSATITNRQNGEEDVTKNSQN